MNTAETNDHQTAMDIRNEQIHKYWAGDLSRKVYLLRRQRKAILENCRRIAVVGLSRDPESASFVELEKLLGIGLEIIPVIPDCESVLALRCYERLRDVPGKIDIVQVYPQERIDLLPLARDAVQKGVSTFWIEPGLLASAEIEQILADGKIQLVQYENLVTEYLKHTPSLTPVTTPQRREKKAATVRDHMTKNPVTVTPDEALTEALEKMTRGRFRHLPVVDENGKLVAVLSDRDIRLIRPSLAFVEKEDALIQFSSTAVQQAAVFDPIKITTDTFLKEAARLMLRWQVGGLPVIDKQEKLVGILTYTDILRAFVEHQENS